MIPRYLKVDLWLKPKEIEDIQGIEPDFYLSPCRLDLAYVISHYAFYLYDRNNLGETTIVETQGLEFHINLPYAQFDNIITQFRIQQATVFASQN